jgi:resuscitation-promoting factor RpfA
MLRAASDSRLTVGVSDSDPKNKKIDHATPTQTPQVLQKTLDLDRRFRDDLPPLPPPRQPVPLSSPRSPAPQQPTASPRPPMPAPQQLSTPRPTFPQGPVPGAKSPVAPPSNIAPTIAPVSLLKPNAARPTPMPQPAPLTARPNTSPAVPPRVPPIAPRVVPHVVTSNPTPAPLAVKAPMRAAPPSPVDFARQQDTAVTVKSLPVVEAAPKPAPVITAPSHVPAFELPLPVEPATVEKPAPRKSGALSEVLAAPARWWQRLGAFAVDGLLIGGLVFLMLSAASLAVGRGGGGDALSAVGKLAVPGAALGTLLSLVYATLSAVLFRGRTAGRLVFAIRLVDKTGDAPQFTRAIVRAVLAVVSFLLFLSGFWLALFDRKGQTLHDKLTGTFIVRASV